MVSVCSGYELCFFEFKGVVSRYCLLFGKPLSLWCNDIVYYNCRILSKKTIKMTSSDNGDVSTDESSTESEVEAKLVCVSF